MPHENNLVTGQRVRLTRAASEHLPDFASDLGPAFQARQSSIETIGGEWRGRFRDGGVEARVMHDTTIHDRLLRGTLITQAEWEAADRLFDLWTGGGFERPATASYGQRAGGQSLDPDTATSADEYRGILRRMPPRLAIRIDGLMMFSFRPTDLAETVEALAWCVEEWGL